MQLTEIILTLFIAIAFSIASFSSYIHYEQKKEVENAINQFIGAVDFSKKMSILRDEPIYLCASSNHSDCDDTWTGPLIIFTSNDTQNIQTILQTFPALPQSVQLDVSSKSPSALYFKPDSEDANNATLTFSDGNQRKVFTLSLYGVLTETD